MKLKDFLTVVDSHQFVRVLSNTHGEHIIFQGFAGDINISDHGKMDVVTISAEYLSAETSILDI